MILSPEKVQDTRDGSPIYSESDSRSRAIAPPPTFPTPEEAPLINLEYHPESSSDSRAIALPTFPTPENAPPPSYSNDVARPAPSANSSYFASPSSRSANAMFAPGTSDPFSRVPARDVMYPSFSPMFLVAIGKTLDKGFPCTAPPSDSNPHPFVSHDVSEGDWQSFLQEARAVATLTYKQMDRSHLPIISWIPIIDELSSYGVKKIMKHRNASKVVNCIDKWNRHFFEQRKIRIVLMKGQVKVSGQNEYLNHTSPSSSNVRSDDHEHENHPPPTSAAGISQDLIDKDDDTYRLYVVPLL